MSDNILIKDATGAPKTMRTVDSGTYHTPVHRIDGYDPVDDMVKVKSMQKKFRDSFIGATVDLAKWDVALGSGGTATVTAGQLTFGSGTAINSTSSLTTKETFTVPFRMSTGLVMSQRIANANLYVEAISVDSSTGVPDGLHSCGFLFDGVTVTQGKYFVQNGAFTPLVSGASTMPTTAGGSVYELEPYADEVWFHGGVLDSTGGRTNSYRRHQQIPDPNATYKLRLRWLNGGTAPTSNTNAVLQFIACQDYAELTAEITAGRGQTVAGQAIGVAVVSMPTTTVAPSGTWSVKGLIAASTATALGALNASIALDISSNASACVAITAVSAPVGMVLTPQLSYDGGVNWSATVFDDPATSTKVPTLLTADQVLGKAASIVLGGGCTHVRVIATSWTSGSCTVQLRGTQVYDPSVLFAAANNTASRPPVTAQVGGFDGANLRTLSVNATGQLAVHDGGNSLTVDGSVTTVAQDNIFWNDSVTVLAAAATAPLVARDAGVAAGAVHRYSAFNASAFADQAGTLRIEVSNDNVTWRRITADTAVSANTCVILSVPIMTRYHRAVFVNGATLQGAFMLNTSFTAA